jgi:cyclophilin family peptidyl-prolyl cis-trans isomerase
LTFQLFDELTPVTVRRILTLVNQGFYTSPTSAPTNLPSKNFHRIAQGFPGNEFIVQGGSVNGNGTGDVNQPGFPFADEFRAPLVFNGQGQLAMANAGDDTNSSQFFVTTGSPRFLDFNHTIFGQLVEGADVLERMTQVSRGANDVPVSPILITGTHVSRSNPNGTVLIDTGAAAAGESATISVTASTPRDGSTDTETFQVSVVANTENQRPFLRPATDQITAPNQPIQFQLNAVSTDPGDQLTYRVAGGTVTQGQAPSTYQLFTPVQNAAASVDANGLVTITPNAGFEGVIDLIVGVRDQVNRSGSPSIPIDAVSNFDTQRITLTVTTNTQPTATPVSVQTDRNEAVTIQLAGQSGNPESQQTLTYELTGPPVHGQISRFNAQTGTLVYTPFSNFQGNDSFGFRVRDVGAPTPNLASEPADVSIQVQGGDPANVPPAALSQLVTVPVNEPVPVQLVGYPGTEDSGQTLTYILDTSGTLGTVSEFNAATGTLIYTPPTGFVGTDTLTFNVRQIGEPGSGLESADATVTFTVTGAAPTGSVRQIGRVLIVTPPPGRLVNPDPNTVDVSVIGGRVSVAINGVIDTVRPPVSELERVVVYGTKASDTITIAPDVPLLATLDGGLGGKNRLQAGDLPTRLHGWFGHNTLRGGASRDALIGRMGRVRFLPSPGDDLAFAGDPNFYPQVDTHARNEGIPPTGQFFRFVRDRLVPVPTPAPQAQGRIVLHPRRANVTIPQFNLPESPGVGQAPAQSPAILAAQQRRAERLAAQQDRGNQVS